MGIEYNASEKEVVTGGRKLYTGLCNFFVVAVNPDKAGLEALGYKPAAEPSYVTKNDNGNNRIRLDFHLHNTDSDIHAKLALWLENEDVVSKAGNNQFINSFGKAAYGKSEEELPDWFDKTGIRKAKVGEASLYEFLSNWANVASEGKIVLDGLDKILAGNVSELTTYCSGALKYNSVRCLLGVRITADGKKYQEVYSKYFGRPYVKSTTYWEKQLNDEYGTFNAQWGNSFELKEYTSSFVATPTPEDAVTGDEGLQF